jgi:FKBP-type peptidyl-prolyl cis-trans isomerase SlyD
MNFKENDFLYIDYDLIDKDANRMVSTTNEEKAKQEKIYKQDMKYGKTLFIVGSPQNVKGLNKEIANMTLKESKKIELTPEEAFGEYNKDLVKVMHLSDFKSHEISPYPGLKVNIDNTIGTVKTVNSGRVIVDFNNDLAGKNIVYNVKVLEKINSDDDKIKALADSNDIAVDKVTVINGSAEIFFGSKINKYREEFIVRKQYLLMYIFTYMPDIRKIIMKEEYERDNAAGQHDENGTHEHHHHD